MAEMEETIEHSGDRSSVAKKLPPVLHRRRFVTAHYDLQEILGGSQWELAHAEIIDDEQRHGVEQVYVFFTCAVNVEVRLRRRLDGNLT
jgi:hypothetical protein